RDNVDCSVFAPARPKRDSTIVVQALVHQADLLAGAVALAAAIDPTANRKGFAKLSIELERGTPVQFFLELPTLAIDTPLREDRWEGKILHVVYEVKVPSSVQLGKCPGALHVMVGGLAVGEVRFELQIEEQKARDTRGFFAWSMSEVQQQPNA